MITARSHKVAAADLAVQLQIDEYHLTQPLATLMCMLWRKIIKSIRCISMPKRAAGAHNGRHQMIRPVYDGRAGESKRLYLY